MLHRLATYLPSAYLLVDCRPPELKGSLSVDILLAIMRVLPGNSFVVYLLSWFYSELRPARTCES
eukprot:3530204-Pleurochrysis_carterae.AAC.1